jgi:hypothetical protein
VPESASEIRHEKVPRDTRYRVSVREIYRERPVPRRVLSPPCHDTSAPTDG